MIGDSKEGLTAAKEVKDTDLIELEEVIVSMYEWIYQYVCNSVYM